MCGFFGEFRARYSFYHYFRFYTLDIQNDFVKNRLCIFFIVLVNLETNLFHILYRFSFCYIYKPLFKKIKLITLKFVLVLHIFTYLSWNFLEGSIQYDLTVILISDLQINLIVHTIFWILKVLFLLQSIVYDSHFLV